MTNAYYSRSINPLPTQRVGSSDLKNEFQSVAGGFDGVAADVARAVKLPEGTADQTISLSAGARANLVLAFDSAGNITAISYGRYRGDWLTATAYVVSDYFRDPASKNVYAVAQAHTSGVLATDISAGRVQLAINVADVEAAKTAAEAAAATATTQAGLATANGAAQVALAAAQVALAEDQADIATVQADAARAIANFAGVWSALSGPLNKPATVHHNGLFYVLVNSLANVAASEPGVTADWIPAIAVAKVNGQTGIVVLPDEVMSIAYADRATLRAIDGGPTLMALVEGLGLFRWTAGSDEPDDDESCFATAAGRWLLEAAAWDLVDAWLSPVLDDTSDRRVLFGAVQCTVTTLSQLSVVRFDVPVVGAAIGDVVVAHATGAPGADNTSTSRLTITGYVSAQDVVTVVLGNPSASTISFISPAPWFNVAVFKKF